MTGSRPTVHAVVPAGIDDPLHPSGGNVYDRRALDGLRGLGWRVVEHAVDGGWPAPGLVDLARLSLLLDDLPDGALLLVDGLIASSAASVLPAASSRLAVVVLLHMPVGPEAGEETVLASSSAVVTPSEWTRSQVRGWYSLRHVYAVRPGTDAAAPASGSGADTSLLCVASVHPGKGHDLLLEALHHLGDRPWTLTCTGSLDADPNHVSALTASVKAYGWQHRVRFTGPLVGSALAAAYDRADVLVLPSRGESYGMVVTEALARGLPVVATRTGGIPEALGRAPGGTLPGLLVAPEAPDALADGLARWIDEPYLRERLRRAAAARRSTLDGWGSTAAELATVLTRVADARDHGLLVSRSGGRR